MKTILKLLIAHQGMQAGDLVEVDAEHVQKLVDAGIAVVYDAEAEKKAAEEAEAAQKAEQSRLQAEIDAKIKELNAVPVKAHAPTIVHDRAEDDPKKGFTHFGEFTRAVYLGSRQGATPDKRLMYQSEEKAVSGMSVGIDSDGGFLIPEAFSAVLMDKTRAGSQIASRCQRIPMEYDNINIPCVVETSRADGSRQGGVRVYFKAEAEQRTASKPAIGKIRLELNKLMGFLYDTDELLKWSPISMESLLTTMFANEFAFIIDDRIINGLGAGVPLGVLNASCLTTVAKETGQTAATIVSENIMKMWSRMYAPSRGNAVWLYNQEVEPQFDQLALTVGTGGCPVYMPAGGLADAPYGRIKGRPCIPVEYCAALGTAGDIILADFSQYLYAEAASGIEAATSIHLRFDFAENAMRWVMYVDGQPWWPAALTPYKGNAANTQSPFVVLAARA